MCCCLHHSVHLWQNGTFTIHILDAWREKIAVKLHTGFGSFVLLSVLRNAFWTITQFPGMQKTLWILTHFYSILSEAYLWERKTAGFELHTFVEINSGSLKYFWKKTSFLDLDEKINTTLIATYFKTKATRLHYYLVEQQWIITITSHCHHNEVKWKELLNSH